MKWLCRIGLHSWEFIGFTNLSLSENLKVCRRCGIGLHVVAYGQARIKLSAAEIAELRQKGRL